MNNSSASAFTLAVTGYSTTRTLTSMDVKITPAGGFNVPQDVKKDMMLEGARAVVEMFTHEPFPGIDFKHNGYILLAPSVHASGGRYQWAGDGLYRAPTTPCRTTSPR